MESTQNGSAEIVSQTELFERLEQYPWATDDEFQSGLSAILGPEPDPSQTEALTLRAQCFYFARKFGPSVDFGAYQEWRRQLGLPSLAKVARPAATVHDQTSASPASAQALPTDSIKEKPPYPLSFSHVVELISTGLPVPGIKDIPDTVLEGQASESSAESRKKPWEY